MGVVLAPNENLNRIKEFIGYDPRTQKNNPLPKTPNEDAVGIEQIISGEIGEKEEEKGKE